MKKYQDLLKDIIKNGEYKDDRTGVGCTSLFGPQVRYDLREGYPLLTTKRIKFKLVMAELLWFLKGDTNTKYLNDNGVKFWDEWADENGDLGKIYGHQWRQFGSRKDMDGNWVDGCDQIKNVIEMVKNNPTSRRILVTPWNPTELNEMNLPPCHGWFQLYVSPEGHLDLKVYQRSCDAFIGMPFNIASYALLLSMIAQVTNKKPRYFVHSFGDVHIYSNHMEQVEKQLRRSPRDLPHLVLNKDIKNLDDFTLEDASLIGYNPHPWIPAPIAV
jgi:thymidylate synthase